MDEKPAVLISSLGTEPQIITLALLHLLDKGISIEQVVGIYPQTTDARINSGIRRLRDAWGNLPFAHRVALTLTEIQIEDVTSEEDLKIVYREVHHWVHSFKAKGWRIFLNVSGGRKPIAICALIVAQFLFDANDHLVYLVSSPGLVLSRAFTADPAQYRLLDLPVPLWSEEGAVLNAIAQYDDPWAASMIQREFLHRDVRHRWNYFLETVLAPAERRVVKDLILHGGTNKEIARRIHRSPRTVEHQLSAAFHKLRSFMELPTDSSIDRTALVSLLSPHIRGNDLPEMGNITDVIKQGEEYHHEMRR